MPGQDCPPQQFAGPQFQAPQGDDPFQGPSLPGPAPASPPAQQRHQGLTVADCTVRVHVHWLKPDSQGHQDCGGPAVCVEDKDGLALLVTAGHVLERPGTLDVTFPDGRNFPALSVGFRRDDSSPVDVGLMAVETADALPHTNLAEADPAPNTHV